MREGSGLRLVMLKAEWAEALGVKGIYQDEL